MRKMKKQVKGERITSIVELSDHIKNGGDAMIYTGGNMDYPGGYLVLNRHSHIGSIVTVSAIRKGNMFRCKDSDA